MIKKILKLTFAPFLTMDVLFILLRVLQLYTIILIPYFCMTLLGCILSILFWVVPDFIGFTIDYFYSGIILIFPAYRIHLVWLLICFLITITEDL